ncbi:MAG TPA: dihydropteroate synthase [Nitrospiraceae bacterium]|jgi:dihydropteroate synthase|nr:dihydropteroate synthase [Nitrospiraceae bacterium]
MTPYPARDERLAIRGGTALPLHERVHIMGVVNVTPDSFSDGGHYLQSDAAIRHAMVLVEQGADLLDVGAESSRPGADPVEEAEELRRLLPVVRELAKRTSVPISVDTTKAAVAERALDLGASLINDVSALQFDPRMAQVVARSGAGVVLMHMQGIPKTMQQRPFYANVVDEVHAFLSDRLYAATQAGIQREMILIDPGIGFGKNIEHNLKLLAHLEKLLPLGRPILAGVSRKGFIGAILDRPVDGRLMGTAAAVAVAIMKGVRMVRVHDVAPILDVIKMLEAIVRYQESASVHNQPAE